MAVGYQGAVFIDNKQFLVTGGSLATDNPRIDSEATYAATHPSTGPAGAVGKVFIFDWENVTIGLDTEANYELIDLLFNDTDGWVKDRHLSKGIIWYNNQVLRKEYLDVFWTNMTLTMSESALVTCNGQYKVLLSRVGHDLPVETLRLADNYIAQKFGISGMFAHPLSFDPTSDQCAIPYWRTVMTVGAGLPENVLIRGWELSMTNPFEERFTCGGDTTGGSFHPGPAFYFVSTAEVTLSITFVLANDVDTDVPRDLSDIQIDLGGGRVIQVDTIRTTNDTMPLSGIGDVQTYEYAANAFYNMPRLI